MKAAWFIANLGLVVALAACTDIPELNGTLPPELETAEFPKLVPVEPLLARANDMQITEATADGMAARVSRLRARAARLRHSVIDGDARARMHDGVAPIDG